MGSDPIPLPSTTVFTGLEPVASGVDRVPTGICIPQQKLPGSADTGLLVLPKQTIRSGYLLGDLLPF